MVNVLCFGDSNTFGYIPGGLGRFDEKTRWTKLLQERLGKEYNIIEAGLCGRTTIFEDAIREGMCGINDIKEAVSSNLPVDIMIVMLGTNDCKFAYKSDAANIAAGLDRLIMQGLSVTDDNAKVIVVSPIFLGEGVGEPGFDGEFDAGSEVISRKLGEEYERIAKVRGYYFLDAAKVAEPSKTDRIHLDEQGHSKMAQALYEKIREVM